MNSAQVKNPATTYEEKFFKNSIFARAGYSYKGKYLFNSNFRADASSRFGKENKWGYFPSASIGWRFSEEKFMDWSRKYLDDGKFRVSYGSIGNDRIGPYDALLRYTFGTNYYNSVSGVAANSTFGNSGLTWESVNQFNIGMDLALLKGRLSVSADYYNKTTKDLLYSAPLPSNTGYSTVKVNVGSIQNKGFEFVVSGYPIRTKNWQWNASYNMSINNNTVKELYKGTELLPGNPNLWKVTEDGRLGDFFGYVALGVYAYDQSNAWTPDFNHQLTPAFTNGVFSGYTLDGKPYNGDVTIYPIASNNSLGNARDLSSLYLEDASFIRLRNARITYDLPKKIISKVKLQGVSVFVFGNNLLTWTNYTWYDPEISLGSSLTPGNDNGSFPRKREFGGGINLNF